VNKRGVIVTAWAGAGHAILGALYWLLLQIPESNVFMLTASLLVVVAAVAGAGIVEATALAGLRPNVRAKAAFATGTRRAMWIVLPLALFGAFWWATGFATQWLTAVRGQIDAWFIATFGWTNVGWFHTLTAWVVWFLRYPIAVALGVSLMAALTDVGAGALTRSAWLARAWHWRTALVVPFALLVGFYLPWQFVVPWRPASLPVSWVQPAFAAVKLALVFVVMNLAWVAVLACAGRERPEAPAVLATPATPAAPEQA